MFRAGAFAMSIINAGSFDLDFNEPNDNPDSISEIP
jgi:hypothetical protein